MPSNDAAQMNSGAFGVTRGNEEVGGPSAVPIPGSMGIAQQDTPIVKNNVTVQGGSSGGGAGGIFGGLGKVVGGLLGGLFADGGLVTKGYAEGGYSSKDYHEHGGDHYGQRAYGNTQMDDERYPTSRYLMPLDETDVNERGNTRTRMQDVLSPRNHDSKKEKRFAEGGLNTKEGNYGPQGMLEPPAQESNPTNDAMAMGYLLGAFHQQNYGGTPDTLEQAASEFKNMVGGQSNQEDPQLAQRAMSEAVGGGLNPSNMAEPDAPKGTYGARGTLEPGPAAPQPTPQPAPQAPPMQPKPMPMAAPQGQPPQTSTTGYVQPIKFAEGGPPPLAPGQTFQGSGEVNGPGTSTSDSIPAKLSDGEFVMSAAATQFFGVDKLAQMNEKGKTGYMEALHGVEQNQGMPPSAPGASTGAPPASPVGGPMKPPMMSPMAPPGQQKPMMSHGGPAMRPKTSGYCGM